MLPGMSDIERVIRLLEKLDNAKTDIEEVGKFLKNDLPELKERAYEVRDYMRELLNYEHEKAVETVTWI